MDEFGFADAQVGDEVSVQSHRLRGASRTGTIAEVLGSPGHEYFLVRWADGRETTLHPGPDARLQPKGPRRRRPRPAPQPPAPRPRRAAAKPAEPEPAPERGRRELQALSAQTGDRLVIRGHHLGERTRDAEILEVLGEGGGPPFRVRWSDTGREGMLYPGPDALVEHFPGRRGRASRRSG
jgi:hypothetical protein